MYTNDTWHLVLLAAAWTGYAIIHSLTASIFFKDGFRRRFPRVAHTYRLLFNAMAVLLLVPPVWLTFSYHGPQLWTWTGSLGWLMDVLALAAVAGFVFSLRVYDSAEFVGLRQFGCGDVQSAPGGLSLSLEHRFMRHPWYFYGLVIIWSRDMNAAFLVTAVIITLYIMIGSRLEEIKLIEEFGEQYRAYRRRVPALLPRPWRYLDKQGAGEIMAMGKKAGR